MSQNRRSSQSHTGTLKVIMPCAGSGTRLGLPYPKEIHLVATNHALMDFSLKMIAEDEQDIEAIVITLTPEKSILVNYLGKWNETFPHIQFTYFQARNVEWPGSILSAEKLWADYNIVLLPDSYIKEHEQKRIVPTMRKMFEEEEFDVVFAYLPIKPEERDRLRALGALNVEEDGHITDFCDKPDCDLDKFNAFWCSFGFRKEVGRPLLEMMTHSVQRIPVDIRKIGKIGAFPLMSYSDLGTWPAIHDFNVADSTYVVLKQ